MPTLNPIVIFLAALVPLFTGFIWYNPRTFANAWMKETGMTAEDGKNANTVKAFVLTYILGLIISVLLHPLVIHQFGVMSTLVHPDLQTPGTELNTFYTDFMNKYGNNYRTFKHGMLHGVITGLGIVTPIIGINALFERKSFKYVMLNAGYWALTLGLMGGIICQFSK